MKIHFLGTGAADWNLHEADASPVFRRNSAILINDQLIVDPGPCIFEFAETFEQPRLFSDVRYAVCTHLHPDHYSPESLQKLGLTLTETVLFQPVTLGDLRITAVPANHKTAEEPKHLVIEELSTGKRIFYGLDGAWLKYETAHFLKDLHFDLMVFDGTVGFASDVSERFDYRIFEHNCMEMVLLLCNFFQEQCDRFYISHMARTLHGDHQSLSDRLAAHHIHVAYDHLVLEI